MELAAYGVTAFVLCFAAGQDHRTGYIHDGLSIFLAAFGLGFAFFTQGIIPALLASFFAVSVLIVTLAFNVHKELALGDVFLISALATVLQPLPLAYTFGLACALVYIFERKKRVRFAPYLLVSFGLAQLLLGHATL